MVLLYRDPPDHGYRGVISIRDALAASTTAAVAPTDRCHTIYIIHIQYIHRQHETRVRVDGFKVVRRVHPPPPSFSPPIQTGNTRE